MVDRFEELAAWQRCVELSELIFEITRTVSNQRFQFEIRKSADAAPPLIAEGFARFTDAEFIRYLRMARGELAEVQSGIEAGRRKYFTEEAYKTARTLARRAMGTTTNLLKSKLPGNKRS